MELRQIESVVAVAEELHFGRAARRVHLSQPALSQQIKRLEAELGFDLFDRGPRGVTLTVAGAAFLDNARRLLADASQMVADATDAAIGRRGTLRLGFVGSALFSVVPPVVRTLRSEAPGLEVTLVERKTEEQLEMMRDGRLDAGIVKAPDRSVTGFHIECVLSETVGIALWEHHRLAGVEIVDLGDLASEPFVIFPRDAEPDTFDRLMKACADRGFMPEIAQEAMSLQTVLGLVAAGVGVAFVAESVMAHSGRDGVAFRPLTPPTPELVTAMAWPSATTNPAVDVFADVTRRIAAV